MFKVSVLKNKSLSNNQEIGNYIYQVVKKYLIQHRYPRNLLLEKYRNQKDVLSKKLEELTKKSEELNKLEKQLSNQIYKFREQNEILKNRIQ